MSVSERFMEEICRAVCVAKDIDPDAEGHGMGRAMPEGTKFPLWEAQRGTVLAVLSCLDYHQHDSGLFPED